MTFELVFLLLLLIIFGAWAIRKHIRPYFRKKSLQAKWLNKHPQKNRFLTTIKIVEQLYKHSFSYIISYISKTKRNLRHESFTYGEIDPLGFIHILSKTNIVSGQNFYDLGSGAGKAVLTAALAFPFNKAIGVELLPELHNIAKTKQIQCEKSNVLETPSNIIFLNTDLRTISIEDADVLFINATAFRDRLWLEIHQMLLSTKPGTWIIVSTKSLSDEHFDEIEKFHEVMSWGMATIRIYQKK